MGYGREMERRMKKFDVSFEFQNFLHNRGNMHFSEEYRTLSTIRSIIEKFKKKTTLIWHST